MSTDGICEIHRRFGELLPDELRWAEEPDTGERMQVIPGTLRQRDVKVGQHIPISPGALPRFMKQFEEAYSALGKAKPLSQRQQPIIDFCGYTHFWMAMAASRD